MSKQTLLSEAGRLNVADPGRIAVVALGIAAAGVVLQILGGADYPAVPPVFLILLVPAGLIALGRWRWSPLVAVLAGLFLIFGTFASGESRRLLSTSQPVDAIGLWVQMVAVVVATIAAGALMLRNYRWSDVRAVLATRTAQVMGVLFLLIGLIGFAAGQQDFGIYHNLLHLLTGIVALFVGFAGSVRAAKIACGVLGAAYLALGVFGFLLGDPAMSRSWDTGLFTVSAGDHGFHSFVGVLFLAGVAFTNGARPNALRSTGASDFRTLLARDRTTR